MTADGWRWSQREFEIEFPAPRAMVAELRLRLNLPQTSIDKLGAVTLRAEVPREGRHSQTFTTAGVHDFTYRYPIQQHLVATVRVRFSLDKAIRAGDGSGEDSGMLIGSAELSPIPHP
jgi:hypothetical protein